MFPADLLELLRCPITRQTLALVDLGRLADLNSKVTAGELRNAAGETVHERLEAALLRADGTTVYPVRDGIPVLLANEAVTIS